MAIMLRTASMHQPAFSAALASPARGQQGRTTFRCTCQATKKEPATRRELVLGSVSLPLLSLFTFGAAPRPEGLGVKGGQLNLCPKTDNCVSTAEEMNSETHYIPPWSYDPRGKKGKSKSDAMNELVAVVKELKPDNFTPSIIKQTDDYLYAEYQSPTFGFVDDVEFYVDEAKKQVEYRSASRIGESDGKVNRKRIKALRQALEPKGWKSIGFE